MYIIFSLVLSHNYSVITGGVMVSTKAFQAIVRRFETHPGHDYFFFVLYFVISFRFVSFHFIYLYDIVFA